MNAILSRYRNNVLLVGENGNFGNVFRRKTPMCITIEDAIRKELKIISFVCLNSNYSYYIG
jgi:hypothetical protein